eukprot:g6212.t1
MVLASGYRDGERCGKTIAHALAQATHPDRVFFGIVDQESAKDASCLDWFCKLQTARFGSCQRKEQVFAKYMDWSEGKGPVYARSFQTALIRQSPAGPDDFCLQVDAHSQFEKGWDEGLRGSWLKAGGGNEYAVLSTYIHDIGALGQAWARTNVPHVCLSIWGGSGVVRNDRAAGADNLQQPKLNWAWCAGLSYMKCHGEFAVPNDPELKQVFDGEEYSRAARLWTRGYDMYTWERNWVYHDYFKKMGGKGNTAVWNYQPPPEDAALKAREAEHSRKRLWTLFGMEGADGQDLGEYGVGTVRSLDAFYKFSGIDPRGNGDKKKKAEGETCGDLTWVPWQPAGAAAGAGGGAVSAAQADMAAALEPEPEPEPGPGPELEAEAEPLVESEPEPETETEAEAEAGPGPELESQPKPTPAPPTPAPPTPPPAAAQPAHRERVHSALGAPVAVARAERAAAAAFAGAGARLDVFEQRAKEDLEYLLAHKPRAASLAAAASKLKQQAVAARAPQQFLSARFLIGLALAYVLFRRACRRGPLPRSSRRERLRKLRQRLDD